MFNSTRLSLITSVRCSMQGIAGFVVGLSRIREKNDSGLNVNGYKGSSFLNPLDGLSLGFSCPADRLRGWILCQPHDISGVTRSWWSLASMPTRRVLGIIAATTEYIKVDTRMYVRSTEYCTYNTRAGSPQPLQLSLSSSSSCLVSKSPGRSHLGHDSASSRQLTYRLQPRIYRS